MNTEKRKCGRKPNPDNSTRYIFNLSPDAREHIDKMGGAQWLRTLIERSKKQSDKNENR